MSYYNVEKMDMFKCYIQFNNNATTSVKLYTELYDDNHTYTVICKDTNTFSFFSIKKM